MMQAVKQSLKSFDDLTKFSFSFFGLPFLLSGALLPQLSLSVKMLWIFPAFLAARSSGMAFNAWLDKQFDAKNIRTQNRPLPTGRISSQQAALVSFFSLFLFIAICVHISAWLGILGFVAACVISVYSLTKRWTALCHYILGTVHCLAVVMSTTLLTGTPTLSSLFLGLVALANIAGFDIIWAIQDIQFDKQEGLHSIPAAFGIKNALLIAQTTHIFGVIFAFCTYLFADLPVYFLFWPACLSGLYVKFYHELETKEISRLFFLYNSAAAAITLLFFIVRLYLF